MRVLCSFFISALGRLVAGLFVGAVVLARLSAALPADWSNVDVGTVGTSGAANHSIADGLYTIQGSGAGDIGGNADNFHFAHRALSGDGHIVARVDALTNTNAWAKAGVMIRESLNANSKHVFMMVTPGSGTGIKYRASTGGASTQLMVTGAAPRWLKLERRGKMITGFESADGVTWNVVQRVALAMEADAYVGLAVCSKTSGLATMTASQVLIDALDGSVALPWPWAEQGVGAPADAGVALHDGSYVLSNLGADIAGTADKMKYVSQTLIGDGVVTVKVSSVSSADNSTRLGLMMRESLDANARNVVLGLTTSKSVVFMSRRTVAGTLTSRATAVTVAVPAWLRLQRSGDVFTAWRSSDGVTWTEHGSETLELGPTLNVGLAYSNRSTSTWAIGVGDELKLTSPADADGNGLDDAWEVQYFGSAGVDVQADPDGDGLTNSQEWELGNDPQVFNLEGQRPLLELVSGDDQIGTTDSLLAQPLVVRVKDSLSGDPLANIPVFFHVGQGNGRLGAAAPGSSALSLFSDANGLAQSSFLLPVTAGLNRVNVSVGGRQQAGVTSFDLKALAGVDPLLLDIADLGVPALPGRLVYQDGTYTITGATVLDNSGPADRSTFAWRDLTGDGYILARVQFIQADSGLAQAGVMMRESLDAGSPNVAMLLTATSGVAFQARDTVGGGTAVSRVSGVSGPVWVLLRRSGDVFTAFYSVDGVTWTYRATRTLALGATLKVGFTHGTRTTVNNSAAFDGLRMGTLATAPWLVADVGPPRAAAVDDFIAGDSVLVRAGGTDMSGAADNFHYVYQPLVGDGRFIARVASHLSFNSATKSALMVRENLDAGSRHVSLAFAAPSGVTLRKRELVGGATTTATGVASVTAPHWLRVDRLGSRIHTYASADGEAWTSTGTVAFDPGVTPLIGLAASSNDTLNHTQALFDHISLEMAEGSRGWNGAYYADAGFKNSRAFRRDLDLDFSWPSATAPIAGISAGSAFSVRWHGDIVPAYSETYTFTTLSQGAVRVIVNGEAVIDRLAPHSLVTTSGVIALTAGEPVRVVVEYANTPGQDARVRLDWSSASQSEEPVPFAAVRALDSDDDGMFDAWEIVHGLNPNNAADAALDPDGDGLNNLAEYQFGGNPAEVDDRLPGIASCDTWSGIPGDYVWQFTKHSNFHGAPASRTFLTSLDLPQSSADGYGRRARGYIVPSVSGEYRFFLSANDRAELWLSSDDTPFTRVKIARVRQAPTAYHEFETRVEQHSWPIALQAGQAYYFEALHKEATGTDHLSVAWTGPGIEVPAVISGAFLASYGRRADDADDNGLPDAWELFAGLGVAELSAAKRGAHGDADDDRLSNLLEYQHGLDPFSADSDGDGHEDLLEVLVASDPHVASDLNLSPWQLADVGPVSGLALANRVGSDAFQIAGTGSGVALQKEDSFRFLHQAIEGDFELTVRLVRPLTSPVGYAGIALRDSLDSHAVGMTFLQSADGVTHTLFRSAVTGGVNELPRFTPSFSDERSSLAGHWLRMRRVGNLVRLYYSADGLRWIQSYARTLPLSQTCLVGMAVSHGMGPGMGGPDTELPVRRFEDVQLISVPTEPASPQTVPSEATASIVQTINGSAGMTAFGRWAADGQGIVSRTFAGKLDYTFSVPEDGLYRLAFLAQAPTNQATDELFPVEISVDGEFTARVDLILPHSESGLARVVVPWLKAGNHTVRIHHDSTRSHRTFRIVSLAVERLDGPDTNDNGRADWIDERFDAFNTMEHLGASYVSPASISGRSIHRSLLTLQAGGEAVSVRPAPGLGWYADVPLSETSAVEVAGDFENSGSSQGLLLSWVPLNLLALAPEEFPSAVMRIRKGDSLLITAVPESANGGAAALSITAPDGIVTQHVVANPVAQPLRHAFTAPGFYTISAEYSGIAPFAHTSGSLTVEVIEAGFAADPVVGLNNTAVVWENPQIPAGLRLETDPGLLLKDLGAVDGGGIRFATSSSNLADSYVVARIGEGGSVLGHAAVRTLRVATLRDTAMDVVRAYPDGSHLIGVPIIANRLTESTRVEIDIFVQGVTFEDGTVFKVLTKADFDELGRVYLKFLYPAGVETSICHRVRAYEGTVDLGFF